MLETITVWYPEKRALLGTKYGDGEDKEQLLGANFITKAFCGLKMDRKKTGKITCVHAEELHLSILPGQEIKQCPLNFSLRKVDCFVSEVTL
jgi:hypothetical protein